MRKAIGLTLVGILVLCAGFWIGDRLKARSGSALARAAAEDRWASIMEDYDADAYLAATLTFQGSLRPEVLDLIGEVAADSVLLVAVHGRDCLSCEDLGRQLRELVRSLETHPSEWDIRFVVDEGGLETLSSFLRRERITRLWCMARNWGQIPRPPSRDHSTR